MVAGAVEAVKIAAVGLSRDAGSQTAIDIDIE